MSFWFSTPSLVPIRVIFFFVFFRINILCLYILLIFFRVRVIQSTKKLTVIKYWQILINKNILLEYYIWFC